ncbi:hypothetical protein, partial [Raoultella planticola]|uniref:hypothetical protein n=1 Tax=Raoultella planticola TaxID=575 RepID=UPI003A4C5624
LLLSHYIIGAHNVYYVKWYLEGTECITTRRPASVIYIPFLQLVITGFHYLQELRRQHALLPGT